MSVKVQDVIEILLAPLAQVERLEQTVDTLKCGDPAMEVTGIVTTFMPTQRVLEEAASVGANLVIAHEGLYYHHEDATEQKLKHDPVYEIKQQFLHRSGVAVFRFHDYLHRYRPDGIMEGLIDALGWRSFVVKQQYAWTIVEMPATAVQDIAAHVKASIGAPFVRIAGNASARCKRIGLLAGYRGGGELAIPLFEQEKVDLVVYGEGPEWETPEYVRDAAHQGRERAAIVLGHAESEMAGMKWLAERIEQKFPSIPVRFIPNEPVFRIL
ncbi:Nif3-like dinuclear metal center hexameric protein [Marinicrinis lubricantis]|uniref:GTP cyclohydrolase 1 type 2 homolog n=1 Tax=Marinicrinis lubricantis TaxID=2086470 RepID=A0ABW1IKQ6_9BACL